MTDSEIREWDWEHVLRFQLIELVKELAARVARLEDKKLQALALDLQNPLILQNLEALRALINDAYEALENAPPQNTTYKLLKITSLDLPSRS